MFPLTHIKVATESIGKTNRQIILGSLFPDFAIFLGIARNPSHLMGLDFYRYCLENFEDHLDFAKGVLSHSSFAPGLDFYADEDYQGYNNGYCFKMGVHIKDKVREACHLPEHMALWKAHNFIEMAFELHTRDNNLGICDMACEALPKEGEAFCTKLLSEYYNKKPDMIDAMYRKVYGHFAFKDVTALSLATKYKNNLLMRHQIDGLDEVLLSEIILESYDIVKSDYDSFMNYVIDNQTKYFQGL